MNFPWLEQSRSLVRRGLEQKRTAHASLVAGPEKLGKLEFALDMAAALLCLENDSLACGKCRSCRLIQTGAHPDYRYLTFEVNQKTDKLRTEIIVQQVRDLIASLQLTNTLSQHKVAIIYPAEAMNNAATNALLKTLEEPPGDAFLILVSHNPSRLPATIRSRCQAINIRLPDAAAAQAWLVDQHGIDSATAAMALKASAGSPLRALELFNAGEVEQFEAVAGLLQKLSEPGSGALPPWDKLLSLDPGTLWNWLSLLAADHLRHLLGDGDDQTGAVKARARELAGLQLMADQNQRLVPTQVRKDLLLRDWLIQWQQ